MRNPFKVVAAAISGAFRGAVEGAREGVRSAEAPTAAPTPQQPTPVRERAVPTPAPVQPQPELGSWWDRRPGWLGGKGRQPEAPAPLPTLPEKPSREEVGRDLQQAIERDRQAREEERQARERLREQGLERAREQAEQRRAALRGDDRVPGYQPVQRLSDAGGGHVGTQFTSRDASVLNGRLADAAMADRRVILSVQRADGTWRQLFNESGRKYNRGMSASYMQRLVNQYAGGDLGTWVNAGCPGSEGDYEDDEDLADAEGFQLTEFS